jgi:hypothetical protein
MTRYLIKCRRKYALSSCVADVKPLFPETTAAYCENHMKHTNTRTLCGQNAVYINPVRTSQETHYVSATKPNRLMLFRKTVAVYCENHKEHRSSLFVKVIASGTYSYHCASVRL